MKGGDDMSSTEIRAHLLVLAHERLVADEIGMRPDGAYMADLEHEIAEYRGALAGAAVTEIAVLCGELFGRNFG
jgi:hypothetical protein